MNEETTVPTLLEAYETMAKWAAREYPDAYGAAQEAFTELVRPWCLTDEGAGAPDEIVGATSAAFAEWWLFEAPVKADGTTPAEAYSHGGPDAHLRRLASDVAATQVFAQFEVTSQRPEADALTLCDVADGTAYDVVDPDASHRAGWARGLLACRIARLAGTWQMVGIIPMHDVAGDPTNPDPEDARFLVLCRKLLGVDGAYSRSVRVTCQ